MKIQMIGRGEGEHARTMATLREVGHEVHLVAKESATGVVPPETDLVLVEVDSPAEATLDLLRSARPISKGTHSPPYFLVTSGIPEAYLIRAYEAGAEGELRRPFSREYLLARMNALHRRLHPDAAVPQTPTNGAKQDAVQAAPQGSVLGAIDLILRARAWQNATETLRDTTAKFLTLEASHTGTPPDNAAPEIGCSIVLANVQHELEVRVSLGTDAESAKNLAVHMFGPEEGETLGGEVMSELGNVMMGAMKTAFAADSLAFTGGLPETIQGDLVLRPPVNYKIQETFVLSVATAKLLVYLGVRCKGNIMLTTAALREGMVVVKDVFNPKGLLLLKAGTRLSMNMVDKLRTTLPAKQELEVTAV